MFRSCSRGEEDGDDDGRTPFVGRYLQREEIKTAFKRRKARFIQIAGAPCIGKQRLAQQVGQELIEECVRSTDECVLRVVDIPCNIFKRYNDLTDKVLESLLDLQHNISDSENKGDCVLSIIKSVFIERTFLLLSFTKTDNLFYDSDAFDNFCHFIEMILRCSGNTFVIVSAQTRFNINVSYSQRHVCLPKLLENEATLLLRYVLPDFDFEDSEKAIVNGCNCIPGLIIDAAKILLTSDGLLKADELANLLKSPNNALKFFSSPFRPEQGKLRNKIEYLLDRLPCEVQTSVRDLILLQGSFSHDAMAAVLGHKDDRETTIQAILPLKGASILEFDKNTHLYSFNPFVRAYINELSFVNSSDLARLRFINFFVDTMVTVDQKLYQESHKSATEYFHFNYANVQHLMQQAIHCNEDVFPALMRAVSEAEEMFIKCFPIEKVKDFYNHLLQAAHTYGTTEEIAILKMFLAQAMTQLKVDTSRQEVSQLFEEAYSTISARDHHGYHFMTLLGIMGRFNIRQGKYHSGLGFIEKALDMKVTGNDRTRVYRRRIEFLVQQALGELFRGNYEKSEEALNTAHDIAEKEAPYHEAVALISNTFGLICDRSGRDKDKALQWYRSSLSERRKFEKFAPEMLVAPLINIAQQSLKRGNLGYAAKLTEEALVIRKRSGWKDYYTGLALRQKAEILLAKGQLDMAINTCNEALEICDICTPTHFFLNDVRLVILHCHLTSKDMLSANDIYETIIAGKEQYSRDTARGEQTMLTMLHALLLREGDDWDKLYNEFQEETRKLRDLAFRYEDFDKYHTLQAQINDGSRLFTSKRLDSQAMHRFKCREFVTNHCELCQLISFD